MKGDMKTKGSRKEVDILHAYDLTALRAGHLLLWAPQTEVDLLLTVFGPYTVDGNSEK